MARSMLELLHRLEAREAAQESYREQVAEKVLQALATGVTLRQAAATAGVHVATICRWATTDEWLRKRLDWAIKDARVERWLKRELARPPLPRHPHCPACGAIAEVRTAHFGRRFWRCSAWPACPWASWRPRHPVDCASCGGPRYWSRRGKIARCPECEPWPVRKNPVA